MKIVFANTVPGGSIGAIIHRLRCGLEKRGHTTLFLYGRGPASSSDTDIRIGTAAGTLIHGIKTRLADAHGLASRAAVRRFINILEQERPHVLHLHNIHGYWLHFPLLFRHLARLQQTQGLRIVWTLHDSWPLTGGCALPDAIGCRYWENGCNAPECPGKGIYPRALLRRTTRNYILKKHSFTLPERMSLIAPSDFMCHRIGQTFLNKYPRHTIRTTLDGGFWNPARCPDIKRSPSTVLAVAWPWYSEKGWADIEPLSRLLPENTEFRVAGLTDRQRKQLPSSITALPRLSPSELRSEYARATVLVNLSRAETLPTVCLEAQAMGCPVVGYDTGGTAEAVDPHSGVLVSTGHCLLNVANPQLPDLARAVVSVMSASIAPSYSFLLPFLSSTADDPFLKRHLSVYQNI